MSLGLKAVIPVTAMILVMVAGVLMPRGDRIMVFGRPGMSERQMMSILSAADGRLVAGTRLGWIVVAEGSSPRFALDLMKAGALAVATDLVGYGCMKEFERGKA